jgi:hypothetical protein
MSEGMSERTCHVCGRDYKSAEQKLVHFRNSCGAPIEKRRCVVCDSNFTSIRGLREHERTVLHVANLNKLALEKKESPPSEPAVVVVQPTSSKEPAVNTPAATIFGGVENLRFKEPTAQSAFSLPFKDFAGMSLKAQLDAFEFSLSHKAADGAVVSNSSAPTYLGNQACKSAHTYRLAVAQCFNLTLSSLVADDSWPDRQFQATLQFLREENAKHKGREDFLFPSGTYLAATARFSLLFSSTAFLAESASLSFRSQALKKFIAFLRHLYDLVPGTAVLDQSLTRHAELLQRSAATGSRVRKKRKQASDVIKARQPQLVPDIAKFSAEAIRLMEDDLDACLAHALQAKRVKNTIFNRGASSNLRPK